VHLLLGAPCSLNFNQRSKLRRTGELVACDDWQMQRVSLSASRFVHHSVGAGVPSDHLDTEMINSVIGSGEY
jgi:hypothetical protein